MKFIISTLVVLASSVSMAALQPYNKIMLSGKPVRFLKEANMDPATFSKANFRLKPDQAFLQNNYPLTQAERYAITAKDIEKMTQEEIDQLYIRLESGPITPGSYNGNIVMNAEMVSAVRGEIYKKIAGEHPQLAAFIVKMCGEVDPVICIGEYIWKGKRIYPMNQEGEVMLRNAIDSKVSAGIHAALAPVGETVSAGWNSVLDRLGWGDELSSPKEEFTDAKGVTKTYSMLFPAHVYCGQSLFDHRRESIIIDYAWGIDFGRFVKNIDILAGSGYLSIRDEVRMIRPGLYLGRAYTNKIFLLNFVLNNADPNVQKGGVAANSCFDGKTTR
jgi:hypothetical protein